MEFWEKGKYDLLTFHILVFKILKDFKNIVFKKLGCNNEQFN